MGMSKRTGLGKALQIFGDDPEWRQSCEYVRSVFDDYIQHGISRVQYGTTEKDGLRDRDESHSTNVNGTTSMLTEILKSHRDRQFLRDQLLNVFIGAKDTATIGISDVFFHLSRYPKVWRQFRQEVLQQKTPIKPEDFGSMKYLQAVLHESK